MLAWTSAPLPGDLDLLGEVEAVVYLRSDPAHADVFVRLSDVGRDGRSHNITDGIVRLRPGEPAAGDEGVAAARVALWPTGYRVHAGHRCACSSRRRHSPATTGRRAPASRR